MARDLRVQILLGDNPDECEGNCGTDWSAAESLSLAAKSIRDRFGEDIPVESINLTGKTENEVKWSEEIRNRKLALPLLVVNGQVRISGQFDIRQLIDIIETERELGG